MFFDYYYLILVVPAILFALWAQSQVNSAFNQYSKVRTLRGLTGAQAAEAVLRAHGIYDVQIQHIAGNLTDHFDPRDKVIRLSDNVFHNDSVAAVGVAAHEAGHAVQYAEGYGPIKLRNAIIPITQIGSTLTWPLLVIGLILSAPSLIYLGIAFFGCSTVFQAVTLPVEFNASHRAIETIGGSGLLDEDELYGARKVLRAAALTYVAALLMSLVQLLRFVLIFLARGGSGNRGGGRE